MDDFMSKFGVVTILFLFILAAISHYIDNGENRRTHEGWDNWRKTHPHRKKIKW